LDACEELDTELRFPSNLRRLDKEEKTFLFDKNWCFVYSLGEKQIFSTVTWNP
jgi:hypothetical protein